MKNTETRKLGFLKLRFTVKKGSKKEQAILKIIKFENYIKHLIRLSLGRLFNIKRTLHSFKLQGIQFHFYDTFPSFSAKNIAEELNNNISYKFDNLDFKPGDIVVDIGGNIGMVSIFLTKKYPFLKIYAFEPVKENFDNFKSNILLNKISDGIIHLENKAVTKDGRNVNLTFMRENSGGSNIFEIPNMTNKKSNISESLTLEQIFLENNIKDCKLLKMDCEGAEYEILYNAPVSILSRIKHLRGEFHANEHIPNSNPHKLLEYAGQYIINIDVDINEDI
ncbi:MAG: FkbM family methyltransferase [Endomicrobia bacterium]|nr:FkbM family methyltransferase [Endomicrobiia bacterium]